MRQKLQHSVLCLLKISYMLLLSYKRNANDIKIRPLLNLGTTWIMKKQIRFNETLKIQNIQIQNDCHCGLLRNSISSTKLNVSCVYKLLGI